MGLRGRSDTLSAAVLVAWLLVACGPPPATTAAPVSQLPGSTETSASAATPATTSPPGSATQTTAGPSAETPGGTTPAGSPTGSLTQAVPPSSDWRTFTTSDGQLSFDYPAAWTVKDPAGEAPLSGEFVDVVNAAGKQMAALRTNVVTGSECTEKYPQEIFDSQPMQALAESGAADHKRAPLRL